MHIRILLIGVFLLVGTVAPVENLSPLTLAYSSVHAEEAEKDDGMDKVRLILKKMRSSMASMDDFDELEKMGMPKSDVDRMRRAVRQKIQQLTDEAILLIQAL